MSGKSQLKITLALCSDTDYENQAFITFTRFVSSHTLQALRNQLEPVVYVHHMTQNRVAIMLYGEATWDNFRPIITELIEQVFGNALICVTSTDEHFTVGEDDEDDGLSDIREQFKDDEVALTEDEREALGL